MARRGTRFLLVLLALAAARARAMPLEDPDVHPDILVLMPSSQTDAPRDGLTTADTLVSESVSASSDDKASVLPVSPSKNSSEAPEEDVNAHPGKNKVPVTASSDASKEVPVTSAKPEKEVPVVPSAAPSQEVPVIASTGPAKEFPVVASAEPTREVPVIASTHKTVEKNPVLTSPESVKEAPVVPSTLQTTEEVPATSAVPAKEVPVVASTEPSKEIPVGSSAEPAKEVPVIASTLKTIQEIPVLTSAEPVKEAPVVSTTHQTVEEVPVTMSAEPAKKVPVLASLEPAMEVRVASAEPTKEVSVIASTHTTVQEVPVLTSTEPAKEALVMASMNQTVDEAPGTTSAEPTKEDPVVASVEPTKEIPVVASAEPTKEIPVVASSEPTKEIPVVASAEPTEEVPFGASTHQTVEEVPVTTSAEPTKEVPVVASVEPTKEIPVVASAEPTKEIPVVASAEPTEEVPFGASTHQTVEEVPVTKVAQYVEEVPVTAAAVTADAIGITRTAETDEADAEASSRRPRGDGTPNAVNRSTGLAESTLDDVTPSSFDSKGDKNVSTPIQEENPEGRVPTLQSKPDQGQVSSAATEAITTESATPASVATSNLSDVTILEVEAVTRTNPLEADSLEATPDVKDVFTTVRGSSTKGAPEFVAVVSTQPPTQEAAVDKEISIKASGRELDHRTEAPAVGRERPVQQSTVASAGTATSTETVRGLTRGGEARWSINEETSEPSEAEARAVVADNPSKPRPTSSVPRGHSGSPASEGVVSSPDCPKEVMEAQPRFIVTLVLLCSISVLGVSVIVLVLKYRVKPAARRSITMTMCCCLRWGRARRATITPPFANHVRHHNHHPSEVERGAGSDDCKEDYNLASDEDCRAGEAQVLAQDLATWTFTEKAAAAGPQSPPNEQEVLSSRM